MYGDLRISQVAKELGVTPQYLRMLEWKNRIPPARRDFNRRIYSEFDIAVLRSIGVGQRPSKLKKAKDVLGAAR
jgi:DNA-binding transcriptional MerR regulator